MTFLYDLKFAVRSLQRTKGLAVTVNRDENRLIYIRQSAPGIAVENTGA